MQTTDELMMDTDDTRVLLAQYAERAYLDYAVSVVKGRALPDVSDGQKPVQRRILYSMHEMGLSHTAKPVKSARVVGDVLGKFHPHGDSSAYEALVRLAQSFSLRYPLIDGQGNFGSRDGDGAAAMRYTEARLTPIASLLLDELDMGTIDFVPNYDGSMEEPALLPARLPFVLLNGASGIAVGMATEIPSHNLNEVAAAAVAILKRPNISDEELCQLLPAPDFPGGGQITNSLDDIRTMYATGRGSVKVRARWTIEDLARGQWQLVVNELPPNASSQKILEEIEELSNPKVKAGKKALLPEQQNLKALTLSMLDRVRDESSKDAPVRLVFEPKSKNISVEEFSNFLLLNTSLEGSVSLNLVMVGRDGRPTQKSLRAILSEWVSFRQDTVRRRTVFRANKVADRIHILEGREQVLLNIDEVIRIIRDSDEPKPALISAFNLSERQAEDILEIRLRQLARLEAIKIEQELMALREELAGLNELLADENVLKRLVVKEIEADAKKFGDSRRTLLEEAKKATLEVSVVDEPMTVIVSQKGWVRARTGHAVDTATLTFKQGDDLHAIYPCRSVNQLYALDSKGRVYSVPVSALPGGRGDGVPLGTLIDVQDGARLLHYFAGADDAKLAIITEQGLGFSCKASDLQSRVKAGKSFVNVTAGDNILKLLSMDEHDLFLACLSSNGRLLNFSLVELKELGSGGKGVILMGLDDGATLIDALPNDGIALLVRHSARGGKTQELRVSGGNLQPFVGGRAKKGKVIDAKLKPIALCKVTIPTLV
ncbi:DNA topoisomerase IV subunit A [Hydromonas duriensis]|uniref:DNA topoisomerase 4 subunit A n=1 Tax=Hydromonas duriensis TaxID=1527608 RepID=A0A4R6YBY9_9BURK|nr:DNA topoisomerase IV subunit A [Hydromonas duriensis]TDR33121.1 DNA topoisomerase IV subunit A [Hydromonas duriensis]